MWSAYWKILQGKDEITLQDVKAYIDLYDDPLDSWQIDAIMQLDTARLEQWQTKSTS